LCQRLLEATVLVRANLVYVACFMVSLFAFMFSTGIMRTEQVALVTKELLLSQPQVLCEPIAAVAASFIFPIGADYNSLPPSGAPLQSELRLSRTGLCELPWPMSSPRADECRLPNGAVSASPSQGIASSNSPSQESEVPGPARHHGAHHGIHDTRVWRLGRHRGGMMWLRVLVFEAGYFLLRSAPRMPQRLLSHGPAHLGFWAYVGVRNYIPQYAEFGWIGAGLLQSLSSPRLLVISLWCVLAVLRHSGFR